MAEYVIGGGEREAWEALEELDPEAVARCAQARFDPEAKSFRLPCCGQEIEVRLGERILRSPSSAGRRLLEDCRDYSRLSILRYLVHAPGSSPTGVHMKPSEMPGGDFFTQGTHVLPAGSLATRFDHSGRELLERAEELGGRALEFGDVSVEVPVFPKFPLTIVVWFSDEEFPSAEGSVLLDALWREAMPVDIVWSSAMLGLCMLHS